MVNWHGRLLLTLVSTFVDSVHQLHWGQPSSKHPTITYSYTVQSISHYIVLCKLFRVSLFFNIDSPYFSVTKNYANPKPVGIESVTVVDCRQQSMTAGNRKLVACRKSRQLPTVFSDSIHSDSLVLHCSCANSYENSITVQSLYMTFHHLRHFP